MSASQVCLSSFNNSFVKNRVPSLFAAALLCAGDSLGGMVFRDGLVWLSGRSGEGVVGVGTVKFNGMDGARSLVTDVATNAEGAVVLTESVEYNPEAKLTAVIRDANGRYDLDFTLSAPSNFSTWGAQGTLKGVKGTTKSFPCEKHGIWNRCKANPELGEPYETYCAKLKRIGTKTDAVWYVLGGDENWSGSVSEHFRFTEMSNGVATAHVTLYAARADEEGFEVAARHAGAKLAIRLSTPQRNNLFESGEPELLVDVANVTDEVLKGVGFSVLVRDWDGSNVLSRTSRRDIAAHSRKRGRLIVPVSGRGLWFCEARARTVDGKEVFTRTNVAILPPHRFGHRKESVFGIINGVGRHFRDHKEEELALMARMGAHWWRGGDEWELMGKYGLEPISQIDFSIRDGKRFSPTDSNDVKQVRVCVKSLIDHNVVYAEMGNEIGHFATTEERHRLFSNYITWLDAYRSERERQGGTFKIIYGTSAFRLDLMRLMEEYEVWRKLDEYVIHPARGFWTADKDAGGWRYLGLIRSTRRILEDELGIRNPQFHLTEVYAKTLPNNPWADSYRQSAENILLTAALAVSEPGVRSFMVHKLHEGISWDDNGINPDNMEYHYGLLHRDDSPKPSFMGYVTAAEELDGAKFDRWIFRDKCDDKLRGLVYNTPRGLLALLWDRIEGEHLTDHAPVPRAKGEPFFHYEPWIDHWRVKNSRMFKTSGRTVTVIDPIGRRRTLHSKGGKIELTLDGGPVFVYGLDLAEFTDRDRHEAKHKAEDVEEIDRQNRE